MLVLPNEDVDDEERENELRGRSDVLELEREDELTPDERRTDEVPNDEL